MLSSRYLLTALLIGCRATPGPTPRELVGLIDIDPALILCSSRAPSSFCEVQAPARKYVLTFAPTGGACRYAEYRLVPLTAFDSSFRATVAAFVGRFGESHLIGNRFHEWSRPEFTAFVSNQRADYDPPAPSDSLGAVIVGYRSADSTLCPRS